MLGYGRRDRLKGITEENAELIAKLSGAEWREVIRRIGICMHMFAPAVPRSVVLNLVAHDVFNEKKQKEKESRQSIMGAGKTIKKKALPEIENGLNETFIYFC